ncbi:MAG TPA: RimK family alpha-L-glutamate ligase [Xanthobacteraceae bacterium]|jgi:RimK family alpha-L-glutamate ligase|nr:RimK family alpha-L-glutamate ligase [Xanthobacteraceae bacterium]
MARRAVPLVALVTDDVDWHARALSKAFAAAGARSLRVDLTACRLETSQPFGIHLPGLNGGVPDAVFVRTMSGGSFQAVTLRLGILHALREIGTVVWNDARAVERCVDKSATSFLLARAGIPTPETWTTESDEAAHAIVARETDAGPLVLKPLFGSQGRGLRLIRAASDLPPPDEVAGVYYLQRFVAVERDGFRDFRLLVSNGRVVAAMMRHAPTWVTNVKQGGRPVAVVADAQMKDLAVRAAAAVGANFAGVDVLFDSEGRPTVLEVNSMPAWSGLQKVTQADLASVLAGDLLSALPDQRREASA